MGDGWGTTSRALRDAAGGFGAAATGLGDAVARARASLAGLGDVFGDDAQGRAFAVAFAPKADEVGRALDAAVRALAATAANLDATDREYRGGDGATAADLNALEP